MFSVDKKSLVHGCIGILVVSFYDQNEPDTEVSRIQCNNGSNKQIINK